MKSKWTVDEIREDYVKKLEDQMEAALGSVMTKKLFSKNFKTHVECINLFKTAFDDEDLQAGFVEITDLIIKWAFIKCVESSNTTFLKEILIFIEQLVFWATEIDYSFLEGEGQILLTILVEKCGVNNNTLKEKVIDILKTISNSSELFPINKTTRLLMRGLNSKNSKTKAEVLHVIDYMVEEH